MNCEHQKRVLLAYSGGLDTSYLAAWLTHERGYAVTTITVDVADIDLEMHLTRNAVDRAGVNLQNTSRSDRIWAATDASRVFDSQHQFGRGR